MDTFRKTIYLAIVLALSLITNPINTHSSWRATIQKYPVEYGFIALATTCIVGKLLYTYYLTNLASSPSIINVATELYTQVKTDLNDYYSLYGSDNQLSDDQLKEKITLNNNRKYPFLHYNKSLIKKMKRFTAHSAAIAYEVKRITLRKNELLENNNSYLLGTLASLEEQGTQLLTNISQTQQLALLLKDRISEFDEYKNDLDNWSEEKKHQWNYKDDSIWHNDKPTTASQESTLVCGNSAAELIKDFNLNYY